MCSHALHKLVENDFILDLVVDVFDKRLRSTSMSSVHVLRAYDAWSRTEPCEFCEWHCQPRVTADGIMNERFIVLVFTCCLLVRPRNARRQCTDVRRVKFMNGRATPLGERRSGASPLRVSAIGEWSAWKNCAGKTGRRPLRRAVQVKRRTKAT